MSIEDEYSMYYKAMVALEAIPENYRSEYHENYLAELKGRVTDLTGMMYNINPGITVTPKWGVE